MKALIVVFSVLACVVGLIIFKFAGRQPNDPATRNSIDASTKPSTGNDNIELSETLKELCDSSGGKVSVAVRHVETDKLSVVDGSNELPLFSVFKLPLAIAVLKNVEDGRLGLDQLIHIGPDELVIGARLNSQRWYKPVDITVKQMLELSIIESDNTSSEKLLQLVGGPKAVTDLLLSLDLQHIDIRTTIQEYVTTRSNPNTGSALGLVKLLTRLQRGELLQASHTELLIGMMQRANTGQHRLRGKLPPGTIVANKTGSGDPTKTNLARSTNDVGLITLPDGRGHLAIAVLLRDLTLPDELQEKLIADLARAAFDAYAGAH